MAGKLCLDEQKAAYEKGNMIKNYTSTVPAARSVAYIEQKLVDHGASNIAKRYDDQKKLVAIVFQIPRGDQFFPIVLPARLAQVEKALRKLRSSRRQPTAEAEQRLKEQAERTAWKILADMVDVKFTMIALEHSELLEVFMPFLYDPRRDQSFFEVMRDNGFKQLAAHKE